MHTPILIANWKMQLSFEESIETAKAIERGIPGTGFAGQVVLCPTFPMLAAVASIRRRVAVGAQDCFWEARGAFTGEVSAHVLHDIGCRYVIIGHSERRALGESDADVSKKLRAALAAGLTPILCIGETADERQQQKHHIVIARQLATAVDGIELSGKTQAIMIAYEPVWAIGTGHAVNPEQIREARAVMLNALREYFHADRIAQSIRIIYGGSVDQGNITAIIHDGQMEGVLVGSASLKSDNVLAMMRALASL